jgi:hypothetical protein
VHWPTICAGRRDEEQNAMSANDLCTIRFVRPSGYADWIRSYTLRVNGKDVGGIRNGGTLEVTVASGVTTIEAEIDWAKAKPLTVTTAPRQTIEVEVSNRWGAWLALWAVTFGRKEYLLLTPRSPTGGSTA